MEPEARESDATSTDAPSEPPKSLVRWLGEWVLLILGVGTFCALAIVGLSHLSEMERCSWSGEEFASDWRITWSKGCYLQFEGKWIGELVVRDKLRFAEAEVDTQRAALTAAIQTARTQGRAEDSSDPEAARQARDNLEALRKLDEGRAVRRDQAGEERGRLARREMILEFMKREKKR